MTLVRCKKCGNEVSTNSKICPACGRNNSGGKRKDIIAGILAVILIWWFVAHLLTRNKVQHTNHPATSVSDSLSTVLSTMIPSTEGHIPDGILASVDVEQSDDEKKYLADFPCIDESECYGSRKFDSYILSKYPDIKKIQFNPSTETTEEDKKTSADSELAFHRGLYFAKQIQLRAFYQLSRPGKTTMFSKIPELYSCFQTPAERAG